ncbi:histidine kinase [Acidovorax sp. Root275]|uniref:CBS domain-containing protein n=1 Tax=Acidovorax sp. Root275 TaxID=1736508 RepID=UPI00071117AE|nr:CBS domain-containing protein [Acidovorax sp. Root275]KRD46667.1 histidine kinase [Acidovorax sp. Root275]
MQTVSDVMTRGIRTMAPSETVTAAAQAMRELDVGALPVCNGARLVGMVTDRDIVVRGVAQELVHAPLSEVMSEGLLYCKEDDTVAAALETMRSQQVRRLPVVDKAQQLVGVVSLGDLATKGEEDTDTMDALRTISEPSEPYRGGLSAASGAAGGGQTD